MEAVPKREFKEVLLQNGELMKVLGRASLLGIQDWYVGAGGIAQTWWNFKHGFNPMHEIKDFDLVYFDPDISYEAEDTIIKKGEKLFSDISIPVEIRNQARVHLWYGKRFGNNEIEPHISTEDAIDRWPTTATSIGVRIESDGSWTFYTPFGLDDLLGLIVRPNKRKITEIIYDQKAERWKRAWPKLEIMPW